MSIRKIKKHHIAVIANILTERKAVQVRVAKHNSLPVSSSAKPTLTVTQKLKADLASGKVTLDPFRHTGSRIAHEMFAEQVVKIRELAPVHGDMTISAGSGRRDKVVQEMAEHYADHLDIVQFADTPESIRTQLMKSRHLDSTPPQHPQIYEYNGGKMVDGSLIIENRPSHKIDPLLIEPLNKG